MKENEIESLKIATTAFGFTFIRQLFLFVVFELGPMGWSPEAQHSPTGQFPLDALPPHDQHEEDQHPVQAVDGIYQEPRSNAFQFGIRTGYPISRKILKCTP